MVFIGRDKLSGNIGDIIERYCDKQWMMLFITGCIALFIIGKIL